MKVWRRSASAGLAALLRREGMARAGSREDCEAVVSRLSRPPQAVPAAVQVSWPVWRLRGHVADARQSNSVAVALAEEGARCQHAQRHV